MPTIPSTTESARRSTGSRFVSIERHGRTVRAVMVGPRIGERESQIIAREIHPAIEQIGRQMKHLVLDLTDVKTMSSLGLGMCIDVRNAARRRGAETIILGLNQELIDLFRMMKVDRLYTIVANEEEVAARLKR